MRFFILVIISILINGCYYSNGCIYTPQMVNCYNYNRNDYPEITKFQKIASLGNTDKEQRWFDAINCGAKYTEDGWIFKTLPRLDNFDEKNINGVRKFSLCMQEKGYKTIPLHECWEKKICN
ncbi:hypothetical protein EDC44_12833 [Cricetibacter osteomyelitidis]|uniref:Uncharacterized protein n=1 Tax=Cricetibacter osteomyelitidis TaxID=1521931 RepID=A0A4R2SRX7_9PAST|nr:hypothetical protein EDC44_12833 [Cricetibacter osteomyelitidis]